MGHPPGAAATEPSDEELGALHATVTGCQPSAEQTEAMIREYDDKARHLGLVEDWDQKGRQHYLDWLFEDWLPAVDPATAPEKTLRESLRGSGFLEG